MNSTVGPVSGLQSRTTVCVQYNPHVYCTVVGIVMAASQLFSLLGRATPYHKHS